MMVSFVLSYLAGNIPQIKEWLQSRKDLQDKISKCYDRALKKWTINDGIRDAEKYREPILMDDLKHLLFGEEVKDKSRAELVRLWIEELRNDKDCYNFILEHKSDLVAIKLDAGFAQVAQMLRKGTNEMREFRQENKEQFLQLMAAIQGIGTTQESITEAELKEKLRQLLNGVVRQMIESLRLVSAKELLDEIEKTFNSTLHKDNDLLATFLVSKADALSLHSPKEANELYHQAYQIKSDDERLMGIEVMRLRKSNFEKAVDSLNEHDEEYYWYYDYEQIEFPELNILCTDEKDMQGVVNGIINAWNGITGRYANKTPVSREELNKKVFSGDFDIAIVPLKPDGESPADMLVFFEGKNEYNVSSFEDEKYDKIISDILARSDNSVMDKMVQAEKYLSENGIFYPLYTEDRYYVSARNVTGIIFHPYGAEADFSSAEKIGG